MSRASESDLSQATQPVHRLAEALFEVRRAARTWRIAVQSLHRLPCSPGGNNQVSDETAHRVREQRRVLINAIDQALEAIPGVAALIRDLVGMNPYQWTSGVKANLHDLKGMALKHGDSGNGEWYEKEFAALVNELHKCEHLLHTCDLPPDQNDPSPPGGRGEAREPDGPGLDGQEEPQEETRGLDDLPTRVRTAMEQYGKACEALNKDRPTDLEAYQLLENAYAKSGETSTLPAFSTWTGYLRIWRRETGQQKRKPRSKEVPESSGSIVRLRDT